MTTYSKEQLTAILAAHNEWLTTRWSDAVKGSRADLRDADLTRADLTRADLRGADLTGAVLRGADLTGADLRGAVLRGAVLRDGHTRWEQYVGEVVPALCVAGGKALDEVANPGTWACHTWGSDKEPLGCPMATAFSCHSVAGIPALYRQLANDFIPLFDQGLIPLGAVNPKYATPTPTPPETTK